MAFMDDVSSGETEVSSQEPFSSDDDIAYPNYSVDDSSESSNDELNQQVANTLDEVPAQEVEQGMGDGTNEPSDDDWEDDIANIPNFNFDAASAGLQLEFENAVPTAIECFEKLWDNEALRLISSSMNNYRDRLARTNRPHRRNSRYGNIKVISPNEVKQFLALCILQGQKKHPSIRKMFSMDPLYYAPVFHHTLSGRRFEQLLRCFSCAYGYERQPGDKLHRITPLMDLLLLKFRNAYYPQENLSLDLCFFEKD